ncbi:MAG: glycosyltransferase family 2 protein [Burkholderiaceae bacterium]
MTQTRPVAISGFTFLRNGVSYGYPFEASIRSVLPLVDEFIIALGDCSDGTGEALEAIGDPKLRVVRTQWNESMRDRGFVYGQQKMIAHYCCQGDWALYVEGDEVFHEDDLAGIRAAAQAAQTDARVEAFAFRYHHFFGSPGWTAIGPGWYRTAVRMIRNTLRAYSPDGLFFTVSDGDNKRTRYPRAIVLPQHVYHYGHVRTVEQMREKLRAVGKYWNVEQDFERYAIDPRFLRSFDGAHPEAVADWLQRNAVRDFAPDPAHVATRRERRHLLKMRMESMLGIDLSRRHYTRLGEGMGAIRGAGPGADGAPR